MDIPAIYASKPLDLTIRFNGDLHGRKNKPRVAARIKSIKKGTGSYQTAYNLPAQYYRDACTDYRYFGMVYAL